MFKPLSHFLMTTSAWDQIVETYDIETLREIRDHGCVSGAAHDHIYYRDTIKFYDSYQDEIVDYLETVVGTELLVDIFKRADASLDHYKNDVAWCYIDMVAGQLVDQYEDITQEELSDSDEYYVADDGEVVFKADLEQMETQAIADEMEDFYEEVKELASTPWGREHLEIVSA